jgi:nicotinamide-nucleotide amidase
MIMPLFPKPLTDLSAAILDAARAKKLRISTAESCTGGLLSGCLTEVAGSSDAFDRGFITYSNDAKMAQLSVDRKTLSDFGAVSAETAIEMAEGALNASHADIAVSVTGVAGPGGGSAEKPVGLVYIAVASRDAHEVIKNTFPGDRPAIRIATVAAALDALMKKIGKVS